ncbi:MAG: formylmethanofuran dehydrogenase subunit C [Burkholderiales bacterium]|nr:formylmethanofuran dehydrogenase subunit C [Burkholderiales bacterium]
MSALKFVLRHTPPSAVDVSGLRPALLAGKSRKEITKLPLTGWNEIHRVGDLFSIRGDDAQRVVVDGADERLLRIGAGMEGGELTVVGTAGDYLGESMRSGTIVVRGDVGTFVGAGMRGGRIDVSGNAGAFAGSGRAGTLQGMAGGAIVVRGNAGDRAGDRMRRGLLLIEGNAGDYCASRMLAGTAVVLGRVGIDAGYLMRRGTLILGRSPAELLPTFNHNGWHDLLAIRLLLESLTVHGKRFQSFARSRPSLSRWLGDLGCDGKGEILIALGRL